MISRRAKELLQLLAGDDPDTSEIVCDGGKCWLGLERVHRSTVTQLLQKVFVRCDDLGGCEHYSINESGRRFLEGLPPYRDSSGQYHETMNWQPIEMAV